MRIFGALVVAALLAGAASASTGSARAAGPTATAIDLGTLGGFISFGEDVNASGQVVGSSNTADGGIRAFSWTQAGGMVDLGSLGGGFSGANAVNAGGQVVGVSGTTTETHAFSWTQAGGMVDLGTLGGTISGAPGVNAR